MRLVTDRAEQFAGLEETVLVLGETGTGKDALAEHMHGCSRRRARPFMTVACGNLNSSLFESELFGHARGAFTDASTTRVGVLEQAQGGTVVLDDIDALSADQQHKLLHFLDRKEILPIGGVRKLLDVRILVTCNQELVELVRQGRFRQDLFFRVGSLSLEIPPLRERSADILPLFRHFASHVRAGDCRGAEVDFSPAAVRLVQGYPWPGNVRQLECIARACAKLTEGVIEEGVVRMLLSSHGSRHRIPGQDGEPEGPLAARLRAIRSGMILRVLEEEGGNVQSTARRLGISRNLVYRTMQRTTG